MPKLYWLWFGDCLSLICKLAKYFNHVIIKNTFNVDKKKKKIAVTKERTKKIEKQQIWTNA